MKSLLKIGLFALLLVPLFAVNSFAQCQAKPITLSGGKIALSGKTGGCNKFKFSITEGQRVKISVESPDSRAKFGLQWSAAEDETGTETFENQKSFDKTLDYPDWEIWVTGTAGANYTLKISVTDE